MKVFCQKCDYPNGLGHLFCVQCGARLVLENVRSEIEEDGGKERTKGRLYSVLLVVAVALTGLAVLALWPAKPFGRGNAAAGSADAVEISLSRLHAAAGSSKVPYTNQPLKEEDINAWLSVACNRAGAKSMTVSIKPDRCTLRVGFTAGPWKLFKSDKTLGPFTYSRDFSCGMTGNGLALTGAKAGHLPMIGPLARMVADRSAKRFDDFAKERLVLSRITGAKIEDGQITVVIMSPP